MANVRIGSVVRAPWYRDGDDPDLTGSVTHVRKGCAEVTWHNNGTVTPAGDESRIPLLSLTDDLVVAY